MKNIFLLPTDKPSVLGLHFDIIKDMKKFITLKEYLKLGGKLEKVNWNDAYCDYGDHNKDAKILSYEDKGEKGGQDIPLFHFTFDNGRTHRYSIFWIKVQVDFVLAETYI